jgi:hypothetical protein
LRRLARHLGVEVPALFPHYLSFDVWYGGFGDIGRGYAGFDRILVGSPPGDSEQFPYKARDREWAPQPIGCSLLQGELCTVQSHKPAECAWTFSSKCATNPFEHAAARDNHRRVARAWARPVAQRWIREVYQRVTGTAWSEVVPESDDPLVQLVEMLGSAARRMQEANDATT